MSILIKGMEMPKACYECRMYQADIYYCSSAERDIDIPDSSEGRCTFCPLVSIPPHGRLLDENKIFEMLEVQREDEYNKTHRPKATWSRVIDCFEDLLGIVDTAIPSEEGE